MKTIIIMIMAGAIAKFLSPPHQRCTAAKDGKVQNGLS
jgi:hypothetical protein